VLANQGMRSLRFDDPPLLVVLDVCGVGRGAPVSYRAASPIVFRLAPATC
jgi:hypothetical protein